MDHLHDACLDLYDASLVAENFCNRSRISSIIKRLNSRSWWSFFQTVHYEKLFRWCNVKWSISLMYLEKKKRKVAVNCPKIGIPSKNREISGPYNFSTPIKSNILDVWNWNWWTFFGSEIELAVMAPCLPPPSPSGYPPPHPPVATLLI